MTSDHFSDAEKMNWHGKPAVLTHRDMATLQAMGLNAMRLSQEELSGVYKGAFRDAVIAVWLAIQPKEGKKAAFRNPEKAVDLAFDWHETECRGSMEGLAELFMALMSNLFDATPDFLKGNDVPGELLPP